MNRFRSAFRRHNNNGGIVPVLAATVVGSSSIAAAAWWYSFEEETTTGAVVRRVRVPLSVSNDSDSTTVHGPTTGTDNNNNNNNNSGTFGLPSTMTTTTTTRCFAATTTTTERTKANNKNHNNSSTSSNSSSSSSEDRPRLIFLGTGSSTGCPKPTCAMRFHQQQRRNTNNNKNNSSIATTTAAKTPRPDPEACQTSFRALAGGDPKTNPDYRNNPSLLIHHYDESSQSYKNIVIDAGKTFREAALRWFPIHGIESLDAIVLTHHHMDAAAGLDDVRGFQQKRKVAAKNDNDNDKEKQQQQQYVTDPMPLYLSEFCHRNLQLQFPWLLPPEPDESNNNNNNSSSSSSNSKGKKEASSSPPSSSTMMMPVQAEGRPVVTRNVASFDATIFRDYRAETPVGGFPIVPLPIWHGADLISHGFAFSLVPGPSRTKTNNTNTKRPRPLNVVYLSDISEMVPETLEYIREKLPPTDILVVDALLWGKNHPVHYGLEQAVETAATIRPRMGTYLVGMSCDSFLPHEAMNAYLRAKYGTDTETSGGSPIIALAHDGLVIDLPD